MRGKTAITPTDICRWIRRSEARSANENGAGKRRPRSFLGRTLLGNRNDVELAAFRYQHATTVLIHADHRLGVAADGLEGVAGRERDQLDLPVLPRPDNHVVDHRCTGVLRFLARTYPHDMPVRAPVRQRLRLF